MHISIEWDAAKAAANLGKHGVSFDEAVTALLDPQALAREDGLSEDEARKATRKEAEFYAEGT